MPETRLIRVADLLLDQENARLGQPVESQQAVYLALAKNFGSQIVTLAKDIVGFGTDPTALNAVVATEAGRYRVLEGNRRTLALKALDTPSIVKGGLKPAEQKRLETLAASFVDDPVEEVMCVVFDEESDAYHWIELRHTGEHGGAGIVSWDANEVDRFRARKGGASRDIAGQVFDFLDKIDGPGNNKGIISTLRRVLNNKYARDVFGLVKDGNDLKSRYPAEEVVKPLRKIVEDLRSGQIKTKHVYESEDIRKYVDTFAKERLPNATTQGATPVAIAALDTTTADTKPRRPRTSTPGHQRPRGTLIPRDCAVNAPGGRISNIYNEMRTLEVDSFPNALSVELRVFVELAVDHAIGKRPNVPSKAAANTSLAKRLKDLAADMKIKGEIPVDLEKAVIRIADTSRGVAAGMSTFNQYVHNQYVFPVPSELRTVWDELQPFMEKLLP